MRGELQHLLNPTLPEARLAVQALPKIPELRLHLLALDSVGPLTHEQAAAVMESPPFWTLCWASGQALARWLLDRPQIVRDRRVVDLGAGSGIVAIAAAMAGCRDVVAVDCDPHARRAARANARLNGVSIQVRGTLPEREPDDLILVADLLYDQANLAVMDELIGRYAHIVIAESRLNPLPLEGFVKLHEDELTTVPDVDEHDDFGKVAIYGVVDSSSSNAQRSIRRRASA
ncbi:MAG: 50S ribosomal protein L11 methyltransferase [Gammaproteobacteria bacterium]